MKILTSLAAGTAFLAFAAPAFAACTGHDTTAQAPSTPIVTAERQTETPRPADAATPVVTPAPEAPADRRG